MITELLLLYPFLSCVAITTEYVIYCTGWKCRLYVKSMQTSTESNEVLCFYVKLLGFGIQSTFPTYAVHDHDLVYYLRHTSSPYSRVLEAKTKRKEGEQFPK